MSISATEPRTYVTATVYSTWMAVLSDGSRLSFKEAYRDSSDKSKTMPQDGDQFEVLIDFDGRRPYIKSFRTILYMEP
jgi:hypothetical protein